jgi:hypothetical protein
MQNVAVWLAAISQEESETGATGLYWQAPPLQKPKLEPPAPVSQTVPAPGHPPVVEQAQDPL